MRCVDPFVKAGEAFPCGKCLPCRFRIRRMWYARLLLEASQHDYSSVVTLTYDQAALPHTSELQPDHFRNWLKRYRKRRLERAPWGTLRFYAVGEYGEKTGRPHYHVVLFGQPSCERGRTGRQWCSDCGCVICADLVDTWAIGECSIERLGPASAAYVAGYVTRKVLLDGSTAVAVRPFTRMSLRPGIGASAMHDVASTVLQYNLPIPTHLEGAGRSPLYLGRYLRTKLHEIVGREPESYQQSPAMQSVFAFAWDNSTSPRRIFRQINEVYASQLQQKEDVRRGLIPTITTIHTPTI